MTINITTNTYHNTKMSLHTKPTKILMIKPSYFRVNEEALESNKFMTITEHPSIVRQKVLEEHQQLYDILVQHKCDVHLFEEISPDTPDSLFCNNWISVHHPQETGLASPIMVTYPMAIPNRRKEVRGDIMRFIKKQYPFVKYYDMRQTADWAFLESTGSMVIDRYNKTIYAGLSPRTYYWKLLQFVDYFEYKLVIFQPVYKQSPIYHTNVMMAIGKTWAVVCFETISELERDKIRKALSDTKRTIIDITINQMCDLCGNILEIKNLEGTLYTVMSSRAYYSFTQEQRSLFGNILHVPFYTIETYGGGGVRCCLAEI